MPDLEGIKYDPSIILREFGVNRLEATASGAIAGPPYHGRPVFHLASTSAMLTIACRESCPVARSEVGNSMWRCRVSCVGHRVDEDVAESVLLGINE